MEQVASDRVAAVLMLDGLTSLAEPRSHILLDQAAASTGMCCAWVPYYPHSQDGRTVETTNVFPALFGLDPTMNPGRAGLERALDGDLHPHCDHFAAFRAPEPAGVVLEIVANIGAHARVSNYSSDQQTWLLCSESRKIRDTTIAALTASLSDVRVSHQVSPASGWRDSQRVLQRSITRFRFIGWCHGALRAAFMQCGLSSLPQASFLAAPELTRSARLAQLRTHLARATDPNDIQVVYCKDPAWAARKNGNKHSAIQFGAEVLSQLIEWAQGRPILVVSDHNSEPGRDETLAGATLVGLFSTKPSELDQLESATAHVKASNRRAAWQQDELFDYLRGAWL